MRDILKNGRYAMFLRKSREDVEAELGGKFETLAKHRSILERLAADMGVEIAHVYEEIVSGGDLAKRAGAQEMLEDVRAGMWDGVFAFDLQRVTRGDMIDQGTVVLAFQLSRTLIITPQKVYDLRDELDGNFAEMEMLFGRMELSRITRRLITGKEEAVRQGQYIGSIAPYGYDKAVIDRKKTLVPNGDAKRVETWFKRIATGDAVPRELADEMNELGISTPRSGMWDRTLILGIIKNPVYKGFVRWNKKRTVEAFDKNGNKEKVRERAKEIVVEGLHEPIVSAELWQQANDAISTRRRHSSSKRYPLQDPLATLLVCAECGRSMGRVKSSKTGYECYQHPKVNKRECWQRGTSLQAVVAALVDALAKEARNASGDAPAQEHVRTSDLLESDLANERKSVETLFRLVEKGMITDEEFAERRRLSKAREDAIMAKLAMAKTADAKAARRSKLSVNAKKAVADLQNYRGRAEEVNDFLKTFIERIEYRRDPETGEIRLGVYFK